MQTFNPDSHILEIDTQTSGITSSIASEDEPGTKIVEMKSENTGISSTDIQVFNTDSHIFGVDKQTCGIACSIAAEDEPDTEIVGMESETTRSSSTDMQVFNPDSYILGLDTQASENGTQTPTGIANSVISENETDTRIQWEKTEDGGISDTKIPELFKEIVPILEMEIKTIGNQSRSPVEILKDLVHLFGVSTSGAEIKPPKAGQAAEAPNSEANPNNHLIESELKYQGIGIGVVEEAPSSAPLWSVEEN